MNDVADTAEPDVHFRYSFIIADPSVALDTQTTFLLSLNTLYSW
jgi:hypothetical protein